ncbi:MAG: T9SS type A sorting domain-containing protein, partial [Fidelibacterota bacterium]
MRFSKYKIVSLGLGVLFWPLAAWSQQNTVLSSALSGGFGVSQADNTTVVTATGEGFVGLSEGQNTRAASGFLAVVIQRQAPLGVDELTGLPGEFNLHQNYPNPFNPSTTLDFDLPVATDIRMVVYDLLGREVIQLVRGRREAGYHQIIWNGRTANGREVPSGIYIVRMMSPGYTKSIKM